MDDDGSPANLLISDCFQHISPVGGGGFFLFFDNGFTEACHLTPSYTMDGILVPFFYFFILRSTLCRPGSCRASMQYVSVGCL